VTVASGGRLGGTGTVGATTVAAGGTIAPGNSIGVLHVNGNLTLASGSTTAIEISPSAADRIAVSGAAALNGALAFTQGAGTYTDGTDFKLVTASSVSGAFSSVTGLGITGLNANITYSATAVDLVLTAPPASGGSNGGGSGGGSSGGGSGSSGGSGGSAGGGGSGSGGTVTNSFLFGTYGVTPNQMAAGNALAAGANTGALYTAMGNLVIGDRAAVPGALGQMAGDIHAGLRGAAIEDSRIVRNAVLGRLGRAGEGTGVWGAAFGGYGSIAGDGNAAALHHDSAGIVAGADMPVADDIRLGIAAAYSADSASTGGRLSTASGDSGHVIGYAGWTGGAFDLRLGGDLGWGNATVVRAIPALSQSLRGRLDTRLGQVFAEGGYRIEAGQARLEPYIGFTHVAATSGAFDESGGSAALSGGEKTDSQTFMAFGLRATLADMFDDSRLTPWGEIAWRHAFGRLRPDQALRLTDAGQDFTVLGAPLDLDSAAIQAGLDFAVKPDAVLSIGYDGTFGGRAQANALRGSFAWRF
jgi:outer membrane autotransporter protein